MLCQEVCLWYQGLQGLGHQVLWTQTLYRMQAPLLRQEMRLRNQGLQSHRCQKVLRRQEVKMSSLDSYQLAHHHRALL
jgi:hypothetical protein